MKKIKTALTALCAASFLFSATPSFAGKETIANQSYETKSYEEKIKKIIENSGGKQQRTFYGLYTIVVGQYKTDSNYVLLHFFLENYQAEFVIVDFKDNRYGSMDIIFKNKDGKPSEIVLSEKEKKEFNQLYQKAIDKFYFQATNEKPSRDWIEGLERSLKQYYREKEFMKKLEQILEKKEGS